MRSGIDFIGRAAVAAQQAGGVAKRLAGFTVDDPQVVLLGRETIYRNGHRVGWLSSGGFGHTLGQPVGYGYVRHPDGVTADWLTHGSYEFDVASVRVPARVSLQPLYDAGMARIKA
jgi:4-methylaminobutanoate oxidase (formaldehyde-forming)